VWNVKRVLILVGGTFASLLGYAIYAFFLSTIDAMPPLPDDMGQLSGELRRPHNRADQRSEAQTILRRELQRAASAPAAMALR